MGTSLEVVHQQFEHHLQPVLAAGALVGVALHRHHRGHRNNDEVHDEKRHDEDPRQRGVVGRIGQF